MHVALDLWAQQDKGKLSFEKGIEKLIDAFHQSPMGWCPLERCPDDNNVNFYHSFSHPSEHRIATHTHGIGWSFIRTDTVQSLVKVYAKVRTDHKKIRLPSLSPLLRHLTFRTKSSPRAKNAFYLSTFIALCSQDSSTFGPILEDLNSSLSSRIGRDLEAVYLPPDGYIEGYFDEYFEKADKYLDRYSEPQI
ncbi:hypothetical protein [Candidatus Odyssella acanthamoebae]|nr:hypothetical protein [Candidatus Paracaedibacter acanthamoebae]